MNKSREIVLLINTKERDSHMFTITDDFGDVVAQVVVEKTTVVKTNQAEIARAIFKEMFAMNPVPVRKEMVKRILAETTLTDAGAKTYLQKYKSDNGLTHQS